MAALSADMESCCALISGATFSLFKFDWQPGEKNICNSNNKQIALWSWLCAVRNDVSRSTERGLITVITERNFYCGRSGPAWWWPRQIRQWKVRMSEWRKQNIIFYHRHLFFLYDIWHSAVINRICRIKKYYYCTQEWDKTPPQNGGPTCVQVTWGPSGVRVWGQVHILSGTPSRRFRFRCVLTPGNDL